MKWMLLTGLLAICMGCDQQVATSTDEVSETNDSAIVVDEKAKTLAADAASDTIDARVILKTAIASADKSNKKVLVHYGSPG